MNAVCIPLNPSDQDNLTDGYLVDVRNFDGSINNVIQGGKIPYIKDADIGIAGYRQLCKNPNIAVITDAQLDLLQDAWINETYLSCPIQQISRERFYDLLEVLPPIYWEGTSEVETFCMMERQYADVTLQVIRVYHNDRHYYLTRYVRTSNRKFDPATVDFSALDLSLTSTER